MNASWKSYLLSLLYLLWTHTRSQRHWLKARDSPRWEESPKNKCGGACAKIWVDQKCQLLTYQDAADQTQGMRSASLADDIITVHRKEEIKLLFFLKRFSIDSSINESLCCPDVTWCQGKMMRLLGKLGHHEYILLWKKQNKTMEQNIIFESSLIQWLAALSITIFHKRLTRGRRILLVANNRVKEALKKCKSLKPH